MPRSSPERFPEKRYHMLRKKRRKKRGELKQYVTAKARNDFILQKKYNNFPKSSKSAQPENEQKSLDHESLLRQQFGPKVTAKARLTRPALLTGMFAKGMHSTYVARVQMNEVTKAYLKEDLHHIIEMANPHKETTYRRQSAVMLSPEPPLDWSCNVDDPSPALPLGSRWDTSPERSAAAHEGPSRSSCSSPGSNLEGQTSANTSARFSPQQTSTPGDPARGRQLGAPKHCGEGGSSGTQPGHSRKPGTRPRIFVPESSADSSSNEDRDTWREASASPICDIVPFLTACNDGAVCGQVSLAALGKHNDWPLRNQRKLQELYNKSRSRGVDPVGLLKSLCSRQEREKGGVIEANSQHSSSQQSTGVQTSPGLLSQTNPSNQMLHSRAGSPASATDSDVDSADLGVGPISPSTLALDPKQILEMMSNRIQDGGRMCKVFSCGTAKKHSHEATQSQCNCRSSCSDATCDSSPCKGPEQLHTSRLQHTAVRNPQSKYFQVAKLCCPERDPSLSSCSSDEDNVKKKTQHLDSASEEESPLVTYYCFRRH